MLFWACAWKRRAGALAGAPSWQAQAALVCEEQPWENPIQVMTQEGSPGAAPGLHPRLLLPSCPMPAAVTAVPGLSLARCPRLTVPQGCPVVGTRLVLLSTE